MPAPIGDSMADTSPLPDAIAFGLIETDDKAIALRSALSQLDDTERLVIQERWLTEDIAPLGALAEFLGISERRVKRIELAAIAKLQMTAARQRSFAHDAAAQSSWSSGVTPSNRSGTSIQGDW